jgi:hypothetical protein
MSTGSWLRTRRKKIVTHTAIVVGFVLFTIFVSVPLFDRLERIPNEAQLHKVQLPAQTTDMRYEVYDVLTDSQSIDIIGWAFVDGQDCQNRELYVVLKSAQRTYVFDTRVDLRLYLRPIAEGLVSNAEYSGFRTLIPTRKISDGEYIVGFYIKYRGNETLHYTDRVVTKSQDSVTTTLITSKLTEVTLPEESGNIAFNITGVSRPGEEHLFLEISGWAFMEGQSTKDSRTYVVLKSDNSTYEFDTIPTFVWGVARQFGNDSSWDLDYSGFIARIPEDQLEDGTYQLGIYIAQGDIQAFRYTGRVVTKS